jgi:hypothetical protein
MTALVVDGKELRAAVVNEHDARAAAGLTMALGAVAFAYANFDKLFWPIRAVSAFFFVDFLLRVTAGLARSPTGLGAGLLTRRQRPHWVSAKPKRFAWTLGLAMAVLGLCLGCELFRLMVRRGWRRTDDAVEICANGACDVDASVISSTPTTVSGGT